MNLMKNCLGWHCDWRNQCKHHALPAKGKVQWLVPIRVGEFCDHFAKKDEHAEKARTEES